MTNKTLMKGITERFKGQPKWKQNLEIFVAVAGVLAAIVGVVVDATKDDTVNVTVVSPTPIPPSPPVASGEENSDSPTLPSFDAIECKLGIVRGSTKDAPFFAEEPCGSALVPKQVPAQGSWFAFVGDGSLVTLSTCSSEAEPSFDSRIRVYRGSTFEGKRCVAGNDDDGSCAHGRSLSSVKFVANQGATYFILVDGRSQGNFALEIECTPPTPSPTVTPGHPTRAPTDPPVTSVPTDPTVDMITDITTLTVTQQTKLKGSEGYDAPGTIFDFGIGYRVAVDKDILVAGGKFDDGGGKAYVYNRSSGTFEFEAVLGPTTSTTDTYGSSVAVSGETIVVCSPGKEDRSAGRCDVYVRNGGSWINQKMLVGSDTKNGDNFGAGVALSGDNLVVGSIYAGDGGGGKVYMFVRSGTSWQEKDHLVANDASSGDLLGRRVALSSSGDTVIAGAQFDGLKSGSAYVFSQTGTGEASSWKLQKLQARDARFDSWFGFDVAISGNTVIVAAQWDDEGGKNSGSVYVFVKSSSDEWIQQAKLKAIDNKAGDNFGYSVSLYGSTLVVGAEGADNVSGSVYVFRGAADSWSELKEIKADDTSPNDHFGFSTALSDHTLVVGAIGTDAVYVFDLE